MYHTEDEHREEKLWVTQERIGEGPEMAWGPRKTMFQLGAEGKKRPCEQWGKSIQGGWNSPGEGLGQGGSGAHSWRLEDKGRGFGEEAGSR